MYVYMYVLYMYVCMFVCMYVWMYVWMYVSMYVCMYLCMYVSVYVCIHQKIWVQELQGDVDGNGSDGVVLVGVKDNRPNIGGGVIAKEGPSPKMFISK